MTRMTACQRYHHHHHQSSSSLITTKVAILTYYFFYYLNNVKKTDRTPIMLHSNLAQFKSKAKKSRNLGAGQSLDAYRITQKNYVHVHNYAAKISSVLIRFLLDQLCNHTTYLD